MAICLVTIDDGNKCLNQVPTYGDRCSEHQDVELKYYYGFYTYPNFRVIDSDIERKNIDPVTLKDTAHSFHHCNLDFIICKDGLILVSSNEINSRALKFRDSVKMSAGIGDWPTNQLNWNEYLNIINVIHILLYCVQKKLFPKMQVTISNFMILLNMML